MRWLRLGTIHDRVSNLLNVRDDLLDVILALYERLPLELVDLLHRVFDLVARRMAQRRDAERAQHSDPAQLTAAREQDVRTTAITPAFTLVEVDQQSLRWCHRCPLDPGRGGGRRWM